MFLSTVKYLLDVFIANDYDWMMQSHDTRKTISDELSFYYANGFYSEENIKNTIQKLKKQKYDFSLYQNVYCGFMIRRVNEKIKKFEHEWWEKYMNTDSIINRDQFPFSILASNSDINLCITKDVNVWNFDKSSPKQLDVTASIKDYNRPNIDEIAKMQEYIVKETKIPIVGGFHFR